MKERKYDRYHFVIVKKSSNESYVARLEKFGKEDLLLSIGKEEWIVPKQTNMGIDKFAEKYLL